MKTGILVLLVSTSLSLDRFCLSDIPPTACKVCVGSVLNKEKHCEAPSNAVKNCMYYSPDGNCAVCVFGFRKSGGVCEPIPVTDHCIMYDGEGKCGMCTRNTLWSKWGCETKKECTISNCSYCGNDARGEEFCQICDQGYFFYNKKCVKDTKNIRNCFYSFDGNKCEICMLNHFMNEGVCYPSSEYHYDLDWMFKGPTPQVL